MLYDVKTKQGYYIKSAGTPNSSNSTVALLLYSTGNGKGDGAKQGGLLYL